MFSSLSLAFVSCWVCLSSHTRHRRTVFVRQYFLYTSWWAWAFFPVAHHSSLIRGMHLNFTMLLSPFALSSVLAGGNEHAWGQEGYECLECTASGDGTFGPIVRQFPVGRCTPQRLAVACIDAARGRSYSLLGGNCNHFVYEVCRLVGFDARFPVL